MKTTLKRNLMLGFGLSLLLLIISSIVSYKSITGLIESSGLVDHTSKVIIELENVISHLKDAETGQRGYLLTGKSDYLQPYIGAKSAAMFALDSVRNLTIDNIEQTKSCADLKNIITRRMTVLQRSVNHKQEKNVIDTLLLDTGKIYMDSVRGIVNVMESREKKLLITRTAQLNTYASYTPVIVISAAILSIIITIVFYLRVTSDFNQKEKLRAELEVKDADINRRISLIRNIAEKISSGDYSVRAVDEGQDGLGGVAYSVNKMASSLQYSFGRLSDKEWTQAGIAGLNDIMIGEKDIDTICFDIIEFLATYTGSSVGTLYVKEDGGVLKLYSGFAATGIEKRKYINVGEGLVGQAAASGKEIILKDIPADNIHISYAAGEIKPVELLILPFFDGRFVKGVVELGSLKPFTEREIDFLKTVTHNIGVAITSTQSRKKLQELLEETQSQAEELQAQHSELEGLNTELEMQTQKLQASDEELRVQQEELLQANQELEERTRLVEEKNQLIVQRNIEIQAKAEELALSTKYKSEFLAKMSHELRTPLNSILLLSRLLSENNDQNLSTDQVEYARVIQSSGKGLLSLIDEILDLSKIESGKMDLDYSNVSLKEICNDVQTLFKPVAGEKNIEFNIHIEDDVPAYIESDKMRLEQIIRNLLSNALKFTSRGFVSLNIATTPGRPDFITVTVKDTGIGIPFDKQKLIFEAFQQADGSTRRRYGGTGLGLSISRQLAKLLKGEIELNSTEGKGSEFILTIPVSRQAASTVPAAESVLEAFINTREDEEQATAPADTYITTLIPENIPDDRNDITVNDKTILIIEDDTNFAKSLLEFAHTRGYRGIVSVRGDEGIELARKFNPVGILLDLQLPVKSGWEVMDELKNNVQTRHIPVHIMSAHEMRKESLMKGAVDFINKPMAFEQMKQVFEKIEYVLEKKAKKVLIVEENPKHAKALAYFLETYQVNTEVKESVEGGIEALQKDEVDCVILDMGIPGQKSYETLDAVKKKQGLENLPIIIFTGKSLSQAEEMRIKQYADSIVVKTAHSYQRILDEVSIFLHLVEENNKKTAVKAPHKKLGALGEVLKNKTVLIADDDIRNIFSLTKSLEKYEMNVLTAVDGKDALNQLKENPKVDVILMDMMMPEMDGYETTAKIKRIPSLKNIPIIAVTAKAMTGDREKCLNAGASDYITKPIDIDQLLSLLRVWLYEKSVN
ncbi:MAG TPA: response regulator [Chitinophagaceae bacterium]|nr:response regulator [Chitinophagaceae bacterium]